MYTAILIVLVIVISGLSFFIYKDSQTINQLQKQTSSGVEQQKIFAEKVKCQQDGEKFNQSNSSDYSLIQGQQFAYSPELNTCLTDVQTVTPPNSVNYAIKDIYSNQTIASYIENMGTMTTLGDFDAFQQAQKKYFPAQAS